MPPSLFLISNLSASMDCRLVTICLIANRKRGMEFIHLYVDIFILLKQNLSVFWGSLALIAQVGLALNLW